MTTEGDPVARRYEVIVRKLLLLIRGQRSDDLPVTWLL
jgi:hypothetical protein